MKTWTWLCKAGDYHDSKSIILKLFSNLYWYIQNIETIIWPSYKNQYV